MLIRLLQSQVHPNPPLRRKLVSALILGGNATVPSGGGAGEDLPAHPGLRLQHAGGLRQRRLLVPKPAARHQPVRAAGAGGEPAAGPDGDSGPAGALREPGLQGGGPAALDLSFPVPASSRKSVATPPGGVPRPVQGGLRERRRGHPRPLVTEAEGPNWSSHTDDVNLALGNLAVGLEAAAYPQG